MIVRDAPRAARLGIAAVICVAAIGKAGQARVEQQLNNLGDNFVWIEAGGRTKGWRYAFPNFDDGTAIEVKIV